jgi:DNA helicase-2/ATP-dependent DNA helicase PcrA
MMTVHAAKGLEFDTVFLTGMEEELFPFRSMDGSRNRDDHEEERRLAYVAVTRARRRLWITYAGRRAIFGQTRYGLVSRFIGDLPKSSIRHEVTPSLASLGGPRSGRGPLSGPRGGPLAEGGSFTPRPREPWVHPQERAAVSMRTPAGPARAPGERYVERDADTGAGGAFEIGTRVEHKTFGVGTVISVDGGADPTVTVKFSGYAPKSIKGRFLRPAAQ